MLRLHTVAKRAVATATKTATSTATATATATSTTTTTTSTTTSTSVTGVDPLDVIPSGTYKQAPNRAETWSRSQRSRDSIFKNDPRFVGKNLLDQPQPLAAIELIKDQPVSYVHSNIAVCHGTDFVQGHPKIYINLDKPKVHSCGYCGAKYARADLKQ
ncbi:hypothetical protein CANINC_003558 [Pichia inconspicua]|uniref:Zinc finger CHCC-type domain-containing protein n=1 Tax=Pichia inconspicua TaxID=52247 RepID=A0A4T0WZE1_9ASCO|nr:hypothetical protein CANINC_003558 [[Candida] inconspicua]